MGDLIKISENVKKTSKIVNKTNMFVAFYVQLKVLSTVKHIYCSELNGA